MRVLLLSGALSLLFTLFLTPAFVRGFARLGWGQFIRQDGPQTHFVKRGTPTMGGIIILLGIVFGYFVAHLITGDTPSYSSMLVIFIMLGLGFVGFLDDFSKIRQQGSLGISPRAKVIGQIVVATAFSALAISFPDKNGETPASLAISFIRDIDWLTFAVFGTIGSYIAFAIWASLIVVSTSNAVNLTDGLDGLAAGSSILVFGAYVLISWWNTSPAKVFMGDTGSLALGGGVAAMAMFTRTELLLPLIAGLFVALTGSVVVQRLYFKATKGRRIFYSSPLHHHYEIKGWAEVTIVVRFWLIAGFLAFAGAGLFYLEWLGR